MRQALAIAGWSPATVLDVGCGTGDVIRHLATHDDGSVRYDGWDPALPASTSVSGHPRVALHRGDPVVAGARADVGLMLDVFEHVPDDVGFLSAATACAPRWVLRIPLDLSVLDVVRPRRLLAARRRYGHLHAYTRHTALAVVAEAGLVVQAWTFHRVPPPTDTWRQRVAEGLRGGLARIRPTVAADLLGGWSLVVTATVPRLAPAARPDVMAR